MQRTTQRRLPQSTWLLDLCLLIITLGCLLLILVGTRPLFIPEEGRYAEIAREMLARHDYLTPHLNGIKYFEKPILFYWLEALAMRLGGVNLWSLRCINALLGLSTCLATYAITRWLYDRRTALLASVILATNVLFFIMTHMISMDLPITGFISVTLYALLWHVHTDTARSQWYAIFLASTLAALGILTKGLIGIVLPVAVVTPWLLLTRRLQTLRPLHLGAAVLLLLALVLPWHLLVAQHNPGFFQFYIIEQHFLRYTTTTVGHLGPWWYFLPILLAGFLPWTVFALPAFVDACRRIKHRGKGYQLDLYWCLWVIIIFVFFSVSKSKLAPYILPLFPALAIITARYLVAMLDATQPSTFLWRVLLVVNILCAALLCIFTHYFPVTHLRLAQHYLFASSLILSLGSIMSFSYHRYQPQRSIKLLIVTTALTLVTFLAAIPAIDTRPTLAFAQQLTPILQPNDDVIAFNQYFHDLPFYLQRCIHILNWKNELSFGASLAPNQPWIIDDKSFWTRVNGSSRVFIVMSKEEYEKSQSRYPDAPFHVWGETRTNVLLSNRAR